jgi:hypothetical protein
MRFANNRRAWRFFYAVCCLVYMGWVGYLGSFDFNRVLGEYRRAAGEVEPGRIHSAALQELSAECRQRAEMQAGSENAAEDELSSILIEEGVSADRDCLSLPPVQVETREAEIREHLLDRQNRAGWKLLLFSLFFGVIFLLFPPVLVYVFAALLVKLFRSVKIVRKE